jgi:hypothetical protein
VHHQLPREFRPQFEAVGLDIEDFTIELPKSTHRLKPDGLHTGSENWNKQWSDFFEKVGDNYTAQDVLDQLSKMRKQFGLEE